MSRHHGVFPHALLGLCLLAAAAPQVPAQGCTQCRDNAGATPPGEQRAFRGAIGLLAGAAVAVCSAAALAMRRSR